MGTATDHTPFLSPSSEGGGRSRFSKALPSVPPSFFSPTAKTSPFSTDSTFSGRQLPASPVSPAVYSMSSPESFKSLDSPLPPLPLLSSPTSLPPAVRRRPVAVKPLQPDEPQPVQEHGSKQRQQNVTPPQVAQLQQHQSPSRLTRRQVPLKTDSPSAGLLSVNSTSAIQSADSRSSIESLPQSLSESLPQSSSESLLQSSHGRLSVSGSKSVSDSGFNISTSPSLSSASSSSFHTTSPSLPSGRLSLFHSKPDIVTLSTTDTTAVGGTELSIISQSLPMHQSTARDSLLESASSPDGSQLWRRHSQHHDHEVSSFQMTTSHGLTAASATPAPSVRGPTTSQSQSPQSDLASPPPRSESLPQATLSLPSISSAPSTSSAFSIPSTPSDLSTRPAPAQSGRNQAPTSGRSMEQAMSGPANKLRHGSRTQDAINTSAIAHSAAPSHTGAFSEPHIHLPAPVHEQQEISVPVLDIVLAPILPPSSRKLARDDFSTRQKPPLPTELKTLPVPSATFTSSVEGSNSLWLAGLEAPQLGPISEGVSNLSAARTFELKRTDGQSSSGESQAVRTSQNQFPPRTTSNPRGMTGPAPRITEKDPTTDPDAVLRESSNRRVSHFPLIASVPAPGSTFRCNPLRACHFTCYHRHKNMERLANRRYPLMCQVCDRADAEDRWKCQWCNVRMCESCLALFNGFRRDLGQLVVQMGSPAVAAGLATVPE